MICKIDGCEKPVRKSKDRGWCSMHYNRWWRHGDPEIVLKKGPPKGTERRKEVLSYTGAHKRVQAFRGKATEYVCNHCGEPASHWSVQLERVLVVYEDHEGHPYSVEPDDYDPLCVPCHKAYDLGRLNAAV